MTLHEALQWCEDHEVQITFETRMGHPVVTLTLEGHTFQEWAPGSPGLKLRRLVQRIEDSGGHA